VVNEIIISTHSIFICSNVYCHTWGEEGMLQVGNKEFILTYGLAVMENKTREINKKLAIYLHENIYNFITKPHKKQKEKEYYLYS